MPGARCLPRRMDPPASRHPGCRRETWPRCVSTRGHPPSRRCPRTACSQSLARQQRRRAVRRVVGVGDVSAPAANLSDYVAATRASCLSRSTSRFEAKRCCGAPLSPRADVGARWTGRVIVVRSLREGLLDAHCDASSLLKPVVDARRDPSSLLRLVGAGWTHVATPRYGMLRLVGRTSRRLFTDCPGLLDGPRRRCPEPQRGC